jgi:hypothetical protein
MKKYYYPNKGKILDFFISFYDGMTVGKLYHIDDAYKNESDYCVINNLGIHVLIPSKLFKTEKEIRNIKFKKMGIK